MLRGDEKLIRDVEQIVQILDAAGGLQSDNRSSPINGRGAIHNMGASQPQCDSRIHWPRSNRSAASRRDTAVQERRTGEDHSAGNSVHEIGCAGFVCRSSQSHLRSAETGEDGVGLSKAGVSTAVPFCRKGTSPQGEPERC